MQGEKKKSTKRCPEKCNFCYIILDGRGELLEKHILQKCPDVPEAVKLQARQILDVRKQVTEGQEGEDLVSPPKKVAKRGPRQSVADAKRHSRGEGEKLLTARHHDGPVETLRDDEMAWTAEAEQMRRMVACHVVPSEEVDVVTDSQPTPMIDALSHFGRGGSAGTDTPTQTCCRRALPLALHR